jgi:hypothetical protein
MKPQSFFRQRVAKVLSHVALFLGPRVNGFAEGVSLGLAAMLVLGVLIPDHHLEICEASLVLANAVLTECLQHLLEHPTVSGHD